jgi:hypothetical protein
LNRAELQEIGHCGGKVTFTVAKNPENGHLTYQIGYRHSRPTAAAFFAVYALPQGVTVAPLPMGGIGDPWPAPPIPGCLPVIIGSDSEGMFGHQCPRCSGYWRGGSSVCPYCSLQVQGHKFLTPAQQRYVSQYCEMLSDALDSGELGQYEIDMDAVADAAGKASDKPPFYYAEQSQQNKFTCKACRQITDILGKFGYCSVCGTRNDYQELEATAQLLRDRINGGGSYESCAKDAVAAFDTFAAQYAKQLVDRVPITPARRDRISGMRFHNLETVAERFGTIFGIELLLGFSDEDIQFGKTMFHRRHVYEHNGGEADEKYIEDSGDTSVRPKQLLHETQESAHRIVSIALRLAANLHRGFHEIFPPLEEPIRWEAQRKKAMADRR